MIDFVDNRFIYPTFDSSVLTSYYTSGGNLSLATRTQVIRDGFGSALNTPNFLPPWAQEPEAIGAEEIMSRLLDSASTINFDDPMVVNAGASENEEFKNLFGLYVGLSRMREIAEFAATDPRARNLLGLLDRRLQQHIGEARSFVSDLQLADTTLIYGVKEVSTTSTVGMDVLTDRRIHNYFGSGLETARGDALSGIDSSDGFTINISTLAGVDYSIAINFSEISGTLNIDNIVDHINDKLSDAGVTTRFATERNSEFSYSFKVIGNSSENLSLDAPTNSEGSVYLAGTRGGGDFADGYLTKLDDLSAGEPNQAFLTGVNSELYDSAEDVAVDSNGNVYVVGTSAGDLDGEANQASNDAYLRKYDAAGNLVYSQLLGAASNASGFAVAVDADDNVIIAGQTYDQLHETAYGGNSDSFITKFDAQGEQLWTRQAAPYGDDGGLALTTDASGNIFLAGFSNGAVGSDVTASGGSDGFISKLNADGTLQYNKQFGSSGSDRATAIAVDDAGSVYVAGEKDGNAVLLKYADGDSSADPEYEIDLGALDGGRVSGIALGANGAVYVTGSTSSSALNGTIANAASGDSDGFISKVTDNGSSGSLDFVGYLGTSGFDQIGDIAVDSSGANDVIYLTGNSNGALDGGTAPSTSQSFFAKLDGSGALQTSYQFGSGFSRRGAAIAFDSDGTNALTRLGLATGPINELQPNLLLSQAAVRPGQYFEIAVDGGSRERVTIEADDTVDDLRFKISKITGLDAGVSFTTTDGQRFLKIKARDGHAIELFAGKGDLDALAGLGFAEKILVGGDVENPDPDAEDIFSVTSLGIVNSLNVKTLDGAENALASLDGALLVLRNLYKDMLFGDDEERESFQISDYNQERISQMQGALTAITSLAQSIQLTNQLRQSGQSANSFDFIV